VEQIGRELRTGEELAIEVEACSALREPTACDTEQAVAAVGTPLKAGGIERDQNAQVMQRCPGA
jgi:hypothetical protein